MVAIIVFLVVTNFIWLSIDETPPSWDAAAHIRSTVLVNQWLTGKFWGNFVDLIRAFWGYPPLLYFVGGLWSLVIGVGVARISILNTVFLVITAVGVYKLAKEVLDNREAIWAVVIFCLMPVIYDTSRNFILDLPLLGWVVWGLWFYFKSGELKDNKYSWWWWGCLVLASLTKLNGFIYFVPMIGWTLVQIARKRDIDWLSNLVWMGFGYGLVVGWWWWVNWGNIFDYLTGLAGQGEPLTDPMNLLNWQTWIHYFRLFFLHQAGAVTGLVFLTGLAVLPKNKKMGFLLGWAIVNYVIFGVIKNKDFRFTMPILPIAAIVVAIAAEKINKKFKYFLPIFVIYLLFMFVNNSFGWPVKKPFVLSTKTFLMGDVEWVGIDDYPVRSAKGVVWPQWKIVGDLEELGKKQKEKIKVLILINKEEINDNNLGMYKEIAGFKGFQIESVGMRSRFGSEGELKDFLTNFEVALVPDETFEPAPFYGVNLEAYRQARDFVLAGKSGMKVVETYDVWGDKKLFLYVRK